MYYEDLNDELTVFADDLELDGYSVRIDTMRSGLAEELRDHLAALMPDIVGAIFVGNLPVKWYRMIEVSEWDTSISVFPCDFYFFDIDGFWYDYDEDGLLDYHDPEHFNEADIWIGRLDPTRISFDNPLDMLKRYFDRNHRYRSGDMPVWAAALSYEYEDWHEWFEYDFSEFEHADIMRDIHLFSPPDYLDRIRGQAYELVSIMCHSSPWRHYMDVGLVYNTDLSILPPHANFYQLFACSGARFVEQDNSACCYLFMGDRALWVVGSTKTGSIITWGLPYFFQGIRDSCVGEVMQDFLTMAGDFVPDWHFGLTILGDPTLKTIYHSRGTTTIDSTTGFPDGTLLPTSGAAADVRILNSVDEYDIYVLAADEYSGTIDKFYYDGDVEYELSTFSIICNAGELSISNDILEPIGAGEGGALTVGSILSGWPQYIERGDGYHSHPFPFKTTGEPAVLYTWRQPDFPIPQCDVYLTFRHGGMWNPVPGFDFRITDDGIEKIYPYAVQDSMGVIWIFWTALYSSDSYVLCRSLSGDLLGTIDTLGEGSMPVAIVDGDGIIHSFWRDENGFCWHVEKDDDWNETEQIWAAHAILNPMTTLDNDGQPALFFAAQHSEANTEIWMISRSEGEWITGRLTNYDGSDMSPTAVFMPTGEILLAWINGYNGELSVRWKIIDTTTIECKPVSKPAIKEFTAYPNPFNDVIMIEWSSITDARIVDISGNVVDILSNRNTRWNASSHPSGVYFIKADGYKTKRIVHLN